MSIIAGPRSGEKWWKKRPVRVLVLFPVTGAAPAPLHLRLLLRFPRAGLLLPPRLAFLRPVGIGRLRRLGVRGLAAPRSRVSIAPFGNERLMGTFVPVEADATLPSSVRLNGSAQFH